MGAAASSASLHELAVEVGELVAEFLLTIGESAFDFLRSAILRVFASNSDCVIEPAALRLLYEKDISQRTFF